MNIYLIHTDYEGCGNIAFSTPELAEQYIIENGNVTTDDVVAVELDGGYSFTYLEPSPLLVAHQEQAKIENEKFRAEMREYRDNQIHEKCGLTNGACQCYAETPCGEFGGVTKKGTKCLNPVLISNGERCHLHR